ncbi:hypothetical protein D3C75_1056860 [compost metagenome]
MLNTRQKPCLRPHHCKLPLDDIRPFSRLGTEKLADLLQAETKPAQVLDVQHPQVLFFFIKGVSVRRIKAGRFRKADILVVPECLFGNVVQACKLADGITHFVHLCPILGCHPGAQSSGF